MLATCALLLLADPAPPGLRVADGHRWLTLAGRDVLELGSPWISTGDWRPVRNFPLEGPGNPREDAGRHGTWSETVATHDGALTLRYEFDLAALPEAAHLQWYLRLEPATFDAAAVAGESSRPFGLRGIAGIHAEPLKRADFVLPDLDLSVTCAAADGLWKLQDVRDAAWAKCYRLEYNRDCSQGGRRSGWFELTFRGGPGDPADPRRVQAAALSRPPATEEVAVPLDGTWQFQPAGGEARDVPVPALWERLPGLRDVHTGTYRRSLDLPATLHGLRTVLRLDAVGDGCEVRLNGHVVGQHLGPALPVEFDLTPWVSAPSEGNRFEILVQDDTCFAIPRESSDWRNVKHWYPRGMGTGNRRGLFQSVSLRGRPPVGIADVRVQTSVREQKLTVVHELLNTRKETVRATLGADVLPVAGGQTVISLPPVAVELPGFVATTVTLTAPLAGLELWQPDHPTLYQLRSTLAAGARTLEQRDTRFGAREAWFEGRDLKLNGIRCNLRGESPSYGEKIDLMSTREGATEMLRKYQRANCNVLRFHSMPAPPQVLDLCDELGMLVIDESGIYASWGMLAPEHPAFMPRCREHLARWVRRDRNHPAVILWSAENEGLNVNALTPAQLAEFGRVIDSEDGTRPVIFDGDGTAYGVSPASVKHYVRTLDDLKERGGRSSGYARDLRHDIYWACAYEQDVPLGCGEFMFPYEPGLRDHEREVITQMGLQARGYRLANWFDIRPYNPSYSGFLRAEGVREGYQEAYDLLVKSFAPVAVFDRDYDALGPFPQPPALKAGEAAKRTLIVYNDEFSDEHVTLSWQVTQAGKRIAGDERELAIGLGEHVLVEIAFTPPAGELTLELTARKAGQERFRDERRFSAQ